MSSNNSKAAQVFAEAKKRRGWLVKSFDLIHKLFIKPNTSQQESHLLTEELSRVSPLLHQNVSEETTSVNPQLIKEDITMKIGNLNELIKNFVASTPDIQGAAIVSPDGLALTSVLPGEMDEERTAAMSAAMLSLGERIGKELVRGTIERILVEGDRGYSIMVGCGNEAVLLVLASKAAKQGLLFLEIKRLAGELTPVLT
ncbi:Roadblock/LC7 family protein [Stanieria cyanosphaera PCC 7437]|uniref:Roadblock/LC7 family protein n=1 Tax=Stanieria cyanosphaera (strain ATCC 29371 / PCC 7437) TaxID=111780 RepID=K9XVI6_STAC7|nr:roadblock/LC7 domain-containing protein [Stanieria cyanosphaera]AFZ36074.1 Roadblock/LC7 family protein [Stanieria cyanosphaera PCC 7437]